MEVRTALERILTRLPGVRLADGTEPVFTPNALVEGVESMQVEW